MIYNLYVVGEKSPNPEDWSPWSEFSLVIASSIEEARKLGEILPGREVTLIPLDKPLHLVTMPEPNLGEDL